MKQCKIKRNSSGELSCKLHQNPNECPTINPVIKEENVVAPIPTDINYNDNNASMIQPNDQSYQTYQNVENVDMSQSNDQQGYDYNYDNPQLQQNNQQGYDYNNYDNQQSQQNNQPRHNYEYNNSQYQDFQQDPRNTQDFVFNTPSQVNVTANVPTNTYSAPNYPVVDYTQMIDTRLVSPMINPYPSVGRTIVPAQNDLDSVTQNLLTRESSKMQLNNDLSSELSNDSIEKLNTLNYLLESGVITYNDYFVKKRDLYLSEFEKPNWGKDK